MELFDHLRLDQLVVNKRRVMWLKSTCFLPWHVPDTVCTLYCRIQISGPIRVCL